MVRLLNNRGVSLVETLVAAALIAIIGLVTARVISRGTRSYRNFEVGREAGQLEPLIRGAALSAIWDYVDRAAHASPPCNASSTPLASAFALPLLPGVIATVLDPAGIDASLPPAAVGEAGLAAKERCRLRQTLFQSSDFSSAEGIYFCIRLEPGPGAAASHGTLLGNRGVFAEIYFSLEDQMHGTFVTCGNYAASVNGAQQPLATLVYSLYWTSQEAGGPMSHHHMAHASLGAKP